MTSKLPTIARALLGLSFFVFGLNGFLHFIPQPKDAMPDPPFEDTLKAIWSFEPSQ